MELEEKAEEVLESLWIHIEERRESAVPLSSLEVADPETVEQLQRAGLVNVTDGSIKLTDQGRPFARNVVRRHRLAERLLVDVLGTRDRLMHDKACKFEHLLDRGLDDSICTLLGHPKVCPHGKPIPPGKCCQQKQAPLTKLVCALSQLPRGQRGKVAYIYAPEAGQLQKLVAMGILPGAPIRLIQAFPSYVFEVGYTQFAVDKEIADAIYIRPTAEETTPETAEDASSRYRRTGGRFGRGSFRWWPRRERSGQP